MQHLAMLVNPNGQWLFPGSPEFLQALGEPDPDYDAEGFAIKNLGFIKFAVVGDKLIEIELHPRNAALAALLAVQHQIQGSGTRLFRISYLDSEWRSEITSSSEHAIRRLSQLCAPVFVAPSRDRFKVEPLDCSTLFEDDTNLLRPLAQKWRASFGRFDSGFIQFALNHDLLPRMLIVGVQPKAPEPVWRFIGDAHSSWLDADDRFRAIGEKMENLPDKEYTQWAAEFYKDVARTAQPRYDRVEAMIQGRSKSYHGAYERLVLPWSTSSDEVLITVCNRRLPLTKAQLPSYSESANSASMNSDISS